MAPLLIGLLALAVQVPADGTAAPPPADSPVRSLAASTARQPPDPDSQGWYGLPALIADGASFAAAAAGFGFKQAGVFVLGGVGYFFGGPINHAVHGHYGAAAGSLVFRSLVAALGAAIFVGVTQGCDSDAGPSCPYGKALALGGGLLAGAAILDDLRLARESGPNPSKAAAVSIAPRLVIAPHLGLLSFAASF